MKKLSFLLAFFALLLITSTSIFAHHKGDPIKKESKKFATVIFYYIGPNPGIEAQYKDPANWSTTPVVACTGGSNICSAQFDNGTYPLVSGKPSPTVLNIIWNGRTTAHNTQIGTTGIILQKRT